jgi:hypothetical protein
MRAPAERSAGGLRRFALVALGIALVFVFGRGASLPYVSASARPAVAHPVSPQHALVTRLTRQHVAQHHAHAHHATFRVDDDDDDDDDGDDSLAVSFWNDVVAVPGVLSPSVSRSVADGAAVLVRPPRSLTSLDAPRNYDARGPPIRRA